MSNQRSQNQSNRYAIGERQITYQQDPFSVSHPNPQFSQVSNISSSNYNLPSDLLEFSIEETDSGEEVVNSSESSEKEDLLTQETMKNRSIRCSTAPARPLTDIEEFRRSNHFVMLEQTVYFASQLIQRSDSKYDLDSQEGQKACKRFLIQLERLAECFKVNTQSRAYRANFSRAYRVLYKEGSLCYLTEILDSAQEGFPYLWVNGEKYVFSREVLQAGAALFNSFCKIQQVLRDLYNSAYEEQASLAQLQQDISMYLEEFDEQWVAFEQLYVLELMFIEQDARKLIAEAIQLERELIRLEAMEKPKGKSLQESQEYSSLTSKLVVVLGQVNAVANSEGKGRDDLAVEILFAAENIYRRSQQSKAVKNLAEQIRKSYMDLRQLLKRYEQNIEVVDPQLKNNPELVECLVSFESSWEKGKTYFLSPKRRDQLIHFSQLIERTANFYPHFKEQVEWRDSELFMTIPALLILKCLANDDKGCCKHYFPPMMDETEKVGLTFKHLRRAYNLGMLAASTTQDYYSLIEREVLGLKIEEKVRAKILEKQFDNLDNVLHKVKILAIELQRYKPTEWNRFLDVALG